MMPPHEPSKRRQPVGEGTAHYLDPSPPARAGGCSALLRLLSLVLLAAILAVGILVLASLRGCDTKDSFLGFFTSWLEAPGEVTIQPRRSLEEVLLELERQSLLVAEQTVRHQISERWEYRPELWKLALGRWGGESIVTVSAQARALYSIPIDSSWRFDYDPASRRLSVSVPAPVVEAVEIDTSSFEVSHDKTSFHISEQDMEKALLARIGPEMTEAAARRLPAISQTAEQGVVSFIKDFLLSVVTDLDVDEFELTIGDSSPSSIAP